MKVHIEKITSYDFDKIYQFIETLQLEEILKDKNKILLKPNLLGAFPPEKAVTTNPVVVDAVITYLKNIGKDIILGDSPGGSTTIKQVWEKTGMKQLAEKHDIPLVNFKTGGLIHQRTKTIKFPITKFIWDVDAVINISKYKTHSLMSYTGAIKNLYGLIPGLKKSDYHKEHPDHSQFAKVISGLYSLVKDRIVINIMDGIVGMEGDGPSAGDPRNFGVMFASKSASALDFVASSMMGFQPDKLEYILPSLEFDGIKPSEIEINNEWQHFKFHKVKIKKIGLYVKILAYSPKLLKDVFKKHFTYYPDFNDKCRKCNICVESCPMQVMTLGKGDAHPIINYDKCIKCMCCHEMCPYQAIYVHKSFLAKFIIK